MKYSASAELERGAEANYVEVWRAVTSYITDALARGVFAKFDQKIRYTPIIMPPEQAKDYPARSKVRRKQNLYDCSPQLDYACFLGVNFDISLREYLHGLEEAAEGMIKLGVSREISESFLSLLERAYSDLSRKK